MSKISRAIIPQQKVKELQIQFPQDMNNIPIFVDMLNENKLMEEDAYNITLVAMMKVYKFSIEIQQHITNNALAVEVQKNEMLIMDADERFQSANVFLDHRQNKYFRYDEINKKLYPYSTGLAQKGLWQYFKSCGDIFDIKEMKLEAVPPRYCIFTPGKPKFFTENGEDFYNNFDTSKNMLLYKKKREQYNIDGIKHPIPKRMEVLFENVIPQKEMRDLFLHNIAYHLETFERAFTFFLLFSISGNGKGTVDKIIELIYGSETYINVSGESYTNNFNAHTAEKIFVCIDEIKKEHKLANALKKIVANNTVIREKKGIDSDVVQNHSFVMLSTNKYDGLQLENNDRRVNAVSGNTKTLELVVKEKLNENIRNYQTGINNDLEDFMSYLACIDLSDHLYMKQIKTDFYQTLIMELPSNDIIVDAIVNKTVVDFVSVNILLSGIGASYKNNFLIMNKLKDACRTDEIDFLSLKKQLTATFGKCINRTITTGNTVYGWDIL